MQKEKHSLNIILKYNIKVMLANKWPTVNKEWYALLISHPLFLIPISFISLTFHLGLINSWYFINVHTSSLRGLSFLPFTF